VATADWSGSVGTYAGYHPLIGVFGVNPTLPTTPLYAPYTQRFMKLHPDLKWSTSAFGTTDPG
jgi:hypothetical protein